MAMGGGGSEGGSAWAAIARKDAAVEPKLDIPSLLSTAGLKTVVVDANALIGGGVKLSSIADQFFTIREVLDEVRDPASRFHLATLPVTIRCLEPSDEALASVTKFSRATGDLQSLSEVDLRLIALTYTLESQVHGTAHIRSRPPPLLVTPSQTRRQRDPPGWGTVENPEEWEGIEDEEPAGAAKTGSRILGLKTLNLDLSQQNGAVDSVDTSRNGGSEDSVTDPRGDDRAHNPLDETPRLVSSHDESSSSHLPPVTYGNAESGKPWKPRRSKPKAPEKQPPNLEGKQNIAEGVDASKGQVDEEVDDWHRASSRSGRRNFLKRETKRAGRKQAAENDSAELAYTVRDDGGCNSIARNANESREHDSLKSRTIFDSSIDPAKKGAQEGVICNGKEENECSESREFLDEEDIRLLEDGTASADDDSNQEASSSPCNDVVESEQSWMMDPLWKSSIACMTADYAMQNVLLQMGLRLLSTTGMHIRELNKWVLKCQACNRVTSDVGRIFCPKCGNGGTLFKVSVTVGENGTVHAGRTRRINLRGTRYSLPMPKGGREGAAQNPILREDQLPNKVLHPKLKKSLEVDDFCSSDVIFTVSQEKKAQKFVGMKTAAAIFGGRRNPNERRCTRKH